MHVYCDIEEELLENEDNIEVPSVRAMCQRCGHTTESFGTSEASIRRCLALMRQECPEIGNNFYVCDE